MKILAPVRSTESPRTKTLAYLLAAFLILLLVSLHTARFAGHDYREDEVNTVHAANVKDIPSIVQWLAYSGDHPPVWRILAVTWIDLFGMQPEVVRFSSTLLTLLTLALVFRLSSDLFDTRTGLIAVIFLGVSPFFQFYGHELRPYAVLALCSIGLPLMFLRWLRHPRYAFAVVGVGVLAVYTHLFALYLIAALMLTFVLLVRWNAGLYLRAFGLFALIGLSFTPWLLPIFHNIFVSSSGGAFYTLATDSQGLMEFLRAMQGMPVFALSGLAIPISLAYPVKRADTRYNAVLRFGLEWRRLYILSIIILSFVLAIVSNTVVHNLTPRNMMIIVPLLAVAAAYQIRVFKRTWQIAILAVVLLSGILGFRKYNLTMPFEQIVATIQPTYQPACDMIVTNVNHHEAGTSSLAYFLIDWLPAAKTQMWHILEPEMRGLFNVEVDVLPNVVRVADDLEQFEAFIAPANRVWFIQYAGPPFPQGVGPLTMPYQSRIEELFVGQPATSLSMEVPPEAAYVVTEYRRRDGAPCP